MNEGWGIISRHISLGTQPINYFADQCRDERNTTIARLCLGVSSAFAQYVLRHAGTPAPSAVVWDSQYMHTCQIDTFVVAIWHTCQIDTTSVQAGLINYAGLLTY